MKAQYKHLNIVARNSQKLAEFYEHVFGCTPAPPERHFSGKWLEEGTGVKKPELSSILLRLPGVNDGAPTLEIFQFSHSEDKPETKANRQGFGHIAFEVDDVPHALKEVLLNGGSAIGKVVSHEVPGAGLLTFVYASDPEGNIIELLNWK
jgi:predicted enzyme related to lactoylglutathione lyase